MKCVGHFQNQKSFFFRRKKYQKNLQRTEQLKIMHDKTIQNEKQKHNAKYHDFANNNPSSPSHHTSTHKRKTAKRHLISHFPRRPLTFGALKHRNKDDENVGHEK